MNNPPLPLAMRPGMEIPPLVPLGTGLRFVIRMGLSPRTEPISDAHVSPQQHEMAPRPAKRRIVGILIINGLRTNPPPPLDVYSRHSDAVQAASPLHKTWIQSLAVPT